MVSLPSPPFRAGNSFKVASNVGGWRWKKLCPNGRHPFDASLQISLFIGPQVEEKIHLRVLQLLLFIHHKPNKELQHFHIFSECTTVCYNNYMVRISLQSVLARAGLQQKVIKKTGMSCQFGGADILTPDSPFIDWRNI